jgi:DeoR family transcriptional regulator, copper-sensing transcriptional repressor
MPTISIDREKKLLEYLQEHENASIQELAEVFGVSNMTIHRDLNKLEQAGYVRKKHGGAALAEKPAAAGLVCSMCGKPVSERTLFLVKLENGEEKHTCCAHCGLILHSRVSDAWQSFTADYLHGHIVSAGQAVYVIESELTVCCVPSVLSFGSQTDAKKFQKGFGGRLADMEQTVQYLHGMMHMPKQHVIQK